MVFNATLKTIVHAVISWRSIILVEETAVPRENHWLSVIDKHFLIMLYQVHLVWGWAGFELTTLVMIGTDCLGGSGVENCTSLRLWACIYYRWTTHFVLQNSQRATAEEIKSFVCIIKNSCDKYSDFYDVQVRCHVISWVGKAWFDLSM